MAGRKSKRQRGEGRGFVVPAGAPAWCRPLDGVDEAEARGFIEPGRRYAIGPAESLATGSFYAAVECEGDGHPFKVLGWLGTWRGTLASWDAAAALMVEVGTEHEADIVAMLGVTS